MKTVLAESDPRDFVPFSVTVTFSTFQDLDALAEPEFRASTIGSEICSVANSALIARQIPNPPA